MNDYPNFTIWLYSQLTLIVAVGSFFIGLILLIAGSKKKTKSLHNIWFLLCLAIGGWNLGYHVTMIPGIAKTNALLASRISHAFGILIVPLFLHLSVLLRPQYFNNRKFILPLCYAMSILLAYLSLTSFVVTDLVPKLSMQYYPVGKIGYALYVLIFVSWILYANLILVKAAKEGTEVTRNQIKYFLFGTIPGFIGGATCFPLIFGIKFPPYASALIILYLFTTPYAVLKYQLMDIKVVVTRMGVFVFVYSLVLGIPFGFAILGRSWLNHVLGENWFWAPMVVVTVLSTIGPSIYLYIDKHAEDRLLQEQRRYQATLRQASAGMGKIKDLKKLLNMIVYVLTHAIQIEYALIYIHDNAKKNYILGASKRKAGYKQFTTIIDESSPLVQYLSIDKNFIVYDEIKQRAQDYKDTALTKIAEIISSLEGELVVPIFIDQELIAIIVMGKKESGKIYTQDDLAVFGILANQTALAIENAKFYEDMKLTNEQLFQAEKMATIGTMADGLSHQINNRFHALGFIAGDALDTIRLHKNEPMSDKIKEIMGELDRAFVRVQDNVVQGGEIVQGLLKYTRRGDVGMTVVDIDAVLKSAIEMVQYKIKMQELQIIRDYDVATIPKIRGNFTQLQEVFFNLIDNSYDAMMQRKNENHDPNYQPTLIVRIQKADNYAQIIFGDNGMGVKDEDMHKLFTPFFTTKLSSKKGTGLGLYVIRKLVEENHKGQVEMISKYRHGTQMKLRLPIAIG